MIFLFTFTLTPLSPSLFPYTPLFRSRHDHRAVLARARDRQPHRFEADRLPVALAAVEDQQRAGIEAGLGAAVHRDRKSTRLNSSHRCNSYAVFCLKKKK